MLHSVCLPQYGELTIVDILDFYDKPMLVSLKNVLDNYFLAIMIDDNDAAETWLFTALSSRRLSQIRVGEISLRDAFLKSEARKAFTVLIPNTSKNLPEIINEYSMADIPVDFLPPVDDRLELKLQNSVDDIRIVADQLQRVVLRFRLHFPRIISREAPIATLGKFFTDLQDLLLSIGQALKDVATESGRFPNSIIAEHVLNMAGVFDSSFGIELVSPKLPNLWGETEVDATVEELVNLFKISNNADQLTERMQFLKTRVAKNYYDLLGDIEKHIDFADIEWAAPVEGRYSKASITKQIAASARIIIDLNEEEPVEVIEVKGELVGLNIHSRSFEITTETGSISGTISSEKVEYFRGVEIGRMYTAEILRKTSMKSTTGKIDITYELSNLVR